MKLNRRLALLLVSGLGMPAWSGTAALPQLLRLAWDGQPPGRDLPEQARVLARPGAGGDAAALAQALLQAPPAALFAAGLPLLLVSSGPPLDAPDRVEVGVWQREGQALSLDLRHTQARAEGRLLERNLRWRPLLRADLPGDLPPGRYELLVTWRGAGAAPTSVQRVALELQRR